MFNQVLHHLVAVPLGSLVYWRVLMYKKSEFTHACTQTLYGHMVSNNLGM